MPRYFGGKKGFQYSWYLKILQSTAESPLIFLHHDEFSTGRLQQLRNDIRKASIKFEQGQATSDGQSNSVEQPDPSLTVIRSSIFGAAMRDFPSVNLADVELMTKDIKGGYAVLSLPVLNPPYLKAIIKALDRSVPSRPPKTQAEIDKEKAEKNADPATPGRRMKKVKPVLVPELRVLGALIQGRILLPPKIDEVANMPPLEALRGQIIGLLSSPATQLSLVLNQAAGGTLARTLEGLKQALEDQGSVS
jgi:ribosomal protein L10